MPKCGRSHGIFSRLVTSASSDIPDNFNNNNNGSYYNSSLNTIFERKQLQKKFKHAKKFGVIGANPNSTTQ